MLATAGLDGGAEARTVVLRGADRDAGTVEIHTDAETSKVAELRRDPCATLHVWEERPRLQLRLRLTVEILTGSAVQARWEALPEAARTNYGMTPAPGAAIPDSDAYARPSDPARFAVLRGRAEEIEVLLLGSGHDRRALFRRADGWQGSWRVP